MSVVLARVDDRLIHGQVVEGWFKRIKIDRVIIVAEKVYKDPMQQALLGWAVTNKIAVDFADGRRTVELLTEPEVARQDVCLLFSTLGDVEDFVRSGGKIASLNIGGLHYAPDKQGYSATLFLDENDKRILRQLKEKNIELETRVLPTDLSQDVFEVIARKENKDG